MYQPSKNNETLLKAENETLEEETRRPQRPPECDNPGHEPQLVDKPTSKVCVDDLRKVLELSESELDLRVDRLLLGSICTYGKIELAEERLESQSQNMTRMTPSGLWTALKSTQSEEDSHAQIIREALNTPGFDVNRLSDPRFVGSTASALHLACDNNIQSHVGVQLLLSDARCDVNLQTDSRDTVLTTAVQWVRFEDDRYADIIRLLLKHPRIDVNKRNGSKGHTALHRACDWKTPVGVRLLLSDMRCDANARTLNDDTPLMLAAKQVYMRIRVETMEAIMIMLLERDALNINHVTKHSNYSALMIRLHLCSNPKFSTANEDLNMVKLFLSYGADPNVPAHLLAYAVNFCSLDICRELLQSGADPNSAFPNTKFSLDQHGDKETALHCAIRHNFFRKVQLLLEHNVDLTVTWRQMNILKFAENEGCSQKIIFMLLNKQDGHITSNWHRVSGKLTLENCEKSDRHNAVDTVCMGFSRMAEHKEEITALEEALQNFLQAISDNLPEQFAHFRFTPILGGSMAEGTKCYQPDEFDFVCKISIDAQVEGYNRNQLRSSDVRFADLTNSDGDIEVVKFAESFYGAVNTTIHRLYSTYSSGGLQILQNSLLIQDKISLIRLLWNGEFFKRMDVHVDLAPCFESEDTIGKPPFGSHRRACFAA